MNSSIAGILIVGCCLVGTCQAAGEPSSVAEPGASPTHTPVEDLGSGHYRIGTISIDKAKGRFSVPGSVIDLQRKDSPIEFIAVTKGGFKSYEAIFQLDTSAVDFNLACIFIGLDASHASQPKQHFDTRVLKGDPVEIFATWKVQGKSHRLPAIDVIRVEGGNHPAGDWLYTGSFFSSDGKYIADEVGSLVGFVHDPASIIQHRTGLGLGDYGAVTANADVLPPPGTPIQLEVSRSVR